MHSEFLKSCAGPEDLPATTLPEVSFIGRSNTGKSSLINALTGNKSLARKGSTPGQTRLINFFEIDRKLIFADLPGYGYAKGRDAGRAKWAKLVDAYLGRQQIEEFLFLVDSRRPFDDVDLTLLRQLSRRIDPVLILTKCDKLNRAEGQKLMAERESELAAAKVGVRKIFLTSAMKKTGIEELRLFLGLPESG